jgi:hypothetical protein
MKKFLYQDTAAFNVFRRMLPFQQNVRVSDETKRFVVLDNAGQNYKADPECLDDPMDLANYLIIRSKESVLLHNAVSQPHTTFAKGSSGQRATFETMYDEARGDLMFNLEKLGKLLKANNKNYDMPVAFATSSMYLMAKHFALCPHTFKQTLIPIFKNKSDLVHAEGLAHAAWGLSRAQIWDEEAWGIIKKLALEKDFEVEVVKHKHWTANSYVKSTKKDHLLQSSFSDFQQDFFYREGSAVFELHDALVFAQEKNSSLQLQPVIDELERRHSRLRMNRSLFLQLNNDPSALEFDASAKRPELA